MQYQWPSWLHKQTNKQRIIWGYKILFLDVMFPLSVRKILYTLTLPLTQTLPLTVTLTVTVTLTLTLTPHPHPHPHPHPNPKP